MSRSDLSASQPLHVCLGLLRAFARPMTCFELGIAYMWVDMCMWHDRGEGIGYECPQATQSGLACPSLAPLWDGHLPDHWSTWMDIQKDQLTLNQFGVILDLDQLSRHLEELINTAAIEGINGILIQHAQWHAQLTTSERSGLPLEVATVLKLAGMDVAYIPAQVDAWHERRALSRTLARYP